MVPCDVYDRYRLQAVARLAGPAVVEEIDSTVVIHPGYVAQVHRGANILIEEARP
jgi:N-methylhydantoinase A